MGRMSPLANKPFTWCFSLGDRLYIGLNTGDESTTLMVRPKSRSGGKPRGMSANTSLNSCTTAGLSELTFTGFWVSLIALTNTINVSLRFSPLKVSVARVINAGVVKGGLDDHVKRDPKLPYLSKVPIFR